MTPGFWHGCSDTSDQTIQPLDGGVDASIPGRPVCNSWIRRTLTPTSLHGILPVLKLMAGLYRVQCISFFIPRRHYSDWISTGLATLHDELKIVLLEVKFCTHLLIMLTFNTSPEVQVELLVRLS